MGESLALQRSEAFLWAPVCMACGILVYFELAREPPLILPLLLLFAFLPGLWFVRSYDALRLAVLGLVLATLGFGAAAWRTHQVYTPILQKKIGPVEVHGVVEAIEYLPGENSARAVIGAVSIEDLSPEETPRRVRIKFRDAGDVQVGSHVKVLAGLNPPSPPVMPGGFDFQRHMYFKGIGAVGFSYGEPREVMESAGSGLAGALQSARAHIAAKAIDMAGEKGAVAAALLVGQRAGIEEADLEAMRAAGLAHILAISGLHVGLFFGFVFFTVRFAMALFPAFALSYPIKKYAAVVAMAMTVFYMFLAGANVPTVRATLMIGVVFGALMLDRTPISMRLVAFSAIVILLIFPESLLSASFQMSFAAVAGLVAFYTAMRPWWSAMYTRAGWGKRAGLYVLGVSVTSVIATLATAGFALYHFQQLAVYGLLANILAMPILTFFVMPAAVLHFVLWPFGADAPALVVMGWGLDSILSIAHFVADLPMAVVHSRLWSGAAFLWFAFGFTMLVLIKGRLRVMALVPFLIFMICVLFINQYDILISSDSKLSAVRLDDGAYAYSDGRKAQFVREQWQQGLGLQDEVLQVWPKEGCVDDFCCGEAACRLDRAGHRIAFLRGLRGFEEACGWAQVIVLSAPAPKCDGAQVIDRFTTWRKGAHAVTLREGQKPQIVAVEDGRGKRPWVARAQWDLRD
ncbi:MAG: ComEC/Rec2 family competence protein [Rhodospirillales bacterium]|nr:ComEC/Rec2 family competence protein [Rhodospirillales bacterium]